MRYIPLKDADKTGLEDWINKSDEILEELKAEDDSARRKVIIRKYQKHWRKHELLTFLSKLSNGKCWYTEARLIAEYPHLEHFRPKSCAKNEKWEKCHEGYWWLAFDIDNYRLSKPLPNTRKSTYFPLKERAQAVVHPNVALSRETPMFLDPTDQEDVELISFNSLGEPEPCPEPPVDLDDWDHQRIEFSIKRYALDDATLCLERKKLWVAIEAMFNEYIAYAVKAKNESCIESRGKAKRVMEDLQKFLDPDKPFTGAIKACFKSDKLGKQLLANSAI